MEKSNVCTNPINPKITVPYRPLETQETVRQGPARWLHGLGCHYQPRLHVARQHLLVQGLEFRLRRCAVMRFCTCSLQADALHPCKSCQLSIAPRACLAQPVQPSPKRASKEQALSSPATGWLVCRTMHPEKLLNISIVTWITPRKLNPHTVRIMMTQWMGSVADLSLGIGLSFARQFGRLASEIENRASC